jgi:hypothetical protein
MVREMGQGIGQTAVDAAGADRTMRPPESDEEIATLPVQGKAVGLFKEHAVPRSQGTGDSAGDRSPGRPREAIANVAAAAIATGPLESGWVMGERIDVHRDIERGSHGKA